MQIFKRTIGKPTLLASTSGKIIDLVRLWLVVSLLLQSCLWLWFDGRWEDG